MARTAGSTGSTIVRPSKPLVCKAAMAVGALFLLLGILGFIPGITTHYNTMEFAGHHSQAKLFGIFQVSILHNLVHLAFGVLGLTLGRAAGTAKAFLIGGGVVYLAVWLYGLLVDKNHSANFLPVNRADDWLHLLLGLGMIALGLLTARKIKGAVEGGRARGQVGSGAGAPRGRHEEEPRGRRDIR
jgi:arginine exporter protein ArgO